jgi:hypothetical protein
MGIFNEIDTVLEENTELLLEASNEEVVKKFLYDDYAKTREEFPNPQKWSKIWGSANVKINVVGGDKDGKGAKGYALTMYATPVLFKDNDGGIYYNKDGKGTTYTKLYGLIDGILKNPPTEEEHKAKWEEMKDSVREVDEDAMEKLVGGEKIDEPEEAPEETPEEGEGEELPPPEGEPEEGESEEALPPPPENPEPEETEELPPPEEGEEEEVPEDKKKKK